jgi:hypothetical protein
MIDTVPRPAVIHPLLRAAYRETKRAWRKAEPTSFATLVAIVDLSRVMERRPDIADLVASLVGGMLPTVEGGDA